MKRVLIILIVLLACGCAANATRPASTARQYTSRFLVGAAAPSAARFRRLTGVRPGIVEHYAPPGTAFSARFAGNAIPLIQLMPYGVHLASVTMGREDTWLRRYARAVARYRRPVVLGFAPEMNGTWYSWGDGHVSPAEYIAAWRHVVTVFRGQGAGNVTWMWTVNVDVTGLHDVSPGPAITVRPWWPGDSWTDWVGVDGYYYRSSQTFGSVFGRTFSEIRALTARPVLISETAIAPSAGQAGKIPYLFGAARAAGTLGLIWFDLPGHRNWQLDGEKAVLAFRRAASSYAWPPISPLPDPGRG